MIGLLYRSHPRLESTLLGTGLGYSRATTCMSTICAARPTRFSRHFAYARPSLSGSKTRVNPLQYEDGPLVWIDLETTGLDPTRNRIIEVAVLITDGNLDLVDEEGCSFVVKSNKNIIDEMNDWCKMQHTISGLLTEVNEATHTAPEVADAVLEYIKRRVPLERAAHLAGSSVHFDAMFLRAIGPDVAEHGGQLIWNKAVDHLHYRIVGMSMSAELVTLLSLCLNRRC
ncbi:hypothetical protein FS749_007803 [Ceratobasidium sp. UAMH 11750]|nr:hypothetical protein FS749_007803 [Ceratobasidium sp. UAMH 11750]